MVELLAFARLVVLFVFSLIVVGVVKQWKANVVILSFGLHDPVCNRQDSLLEFSSGMLPVVISYYVSGTSYKAAPVLVHTCDSWDCHEDTVP
jgi:hypothetical protein